MREELDDALKQLHTTLESIDNLEADEQERLREAVSEISSTLDAKMLQQQTDAFQESHPVLTQTVGRVADMLAQMGI